MTNTGENKRDYSREYEKRKKREKRLHADINKEKAEAFKKLLNGRGVTFAKWLNNQIDKEMK